MQFLGVLPLMKAIRAYNLDCRAAATFAQSQLGGIPAEGRLAAFCDAAHFV
jgi:hypothetical protein